MQISKRKFLKITLSFLASLTISPANLFKACCAEQKPDHLTESLSKFFTCKKSAASIGEKYINQTSSKVSVDELADIICSENKNRYSRLATDNFKEFQKRLKSQVRSDFGNNRVVSINGWVMSYTGANLCALAYLTANDDLKKELKRDLLLEPLNKLLEPLNRLFKKISRHLG